MPDSSLRTPVQGSGTCPGANSRVNALKDEPVKILTGCSQLDVDARVQTISQQATPLVHSPHPLPASLTDGFYAH